ncbi:DUF3558 domain-containing protein [Nocardia jinanensis]|uniref:DUF3558 domain-containing protein n=1 Tax=Nocardia jinanensis TaxID=382504 RepID=A0A917VW68_9NOCA|nr:DUF3558 domain-containing protein [Nocardia jinanensis]GGL32375.1 hypothetical protein GCM10011588_53980 [Nocardia jinanensis]
MLTAKKYWAGIAVHAALAVSAALLVAGCASTVGGEPEVEGQSTNSGEASVEWNPCSQLPEEALRATGADPSQKIDTIDAPGDRALFRVCSWDSVDGPYHVGIGSTALTQDEWYDNTEVTDVKPQKINDRAGLSFYPDNGEQPIRACYVSLPMEGGSLFINVDWQYSQRNSMPESPPCALVIQHAEKLEPYLPN